MKILVLQLARLGDILMTAPTIAGLRRKYPEAEIHFLARTRFKVAAEAMGGIDKLIEFPTQAFVEPLLDEGQDIATAALPMENFLAGLQAENYDEIINLTFSPASSWIAFAAAGANTVVRGYSRFPDGTLQITDAISSYFFAQVGPGRPNRIHVTDLFAAVADADLAPEDWSIPETPSENAIHGTYIVVHAGASQASKTVAPFLWGRIIKNFLQRHPTQVVLIGDAKERAACEEIAANTGFQCINRAGETTWGQTIELVRGADLLIGGDSGPLHIASLTQTPTLNVSVGPVNFWETGPRAEGSVVLRYEKSEDLSAYLVADCASRMVKGEAVHAGFLAQTGIPGYAQVEGETNANTNTADVFAWQLIAALYLDQDFPVCEDLDFLKAVENLIKMNNVVLDQLNKIDPFDALLAQLVDRADQVMQTVAKMVPSAGPLVRWLLTEKTRIAPSTKSNVCREMIRLHMQFGQVLTRYDMNLMDTKGV